MHVRGSLSNHENEKFSGKCSLTLSFCNPSESVECLKWPTKHAECLYAILELNSTHKSLIV